MGKGRAGAAFRNASILFTPRYSQGRLLSPPANRRGNARLPRNRRARKVRERRYVAGTRNVGRLMRLFHDTIEALAAVDAFGVVDETVGWAKLLAAQGEVRTLADLAGEDPLQGATERYRTLRKFVPDLLDALEFTAARPHDPTLATNPKAGKPENGQTRAMPSRAKFEPVRRAA